MFAHGRLNGLGGLVCVVEGDGADVVVEDVCFDDSVEQLTADEAKFTVDRGGSASSIGPCRRCVVW